MTRPVADSKTIKSRIIVAGCGAMGLPMAQALYDAGFDTYGFDIRPLAEFADFRDRMLDSLENLQASDILLLVVRDAQQINELCFGNPGIYKQSVYPQQLIISSTVSPGFINELSERLPGGVDLIDAPMSGAPVAARERTLTFMLGGNSTSLAQLQPAFEAMGKHTFVLGDTGQGMLAKVLNNYIAACNVISVRKSLAHAKELGMPAEKLLEVVNQSSGANWFSSNLQVIDWSDENYQTGNTIGILEKDVNAALDVIDSLYPVDSAETTGDAFGHSMLDALRHLPAMPSKP